MGNMAAVYICIFVFSIAILYDRITKWILTLLRTAQAPNSGARLLPAAVYLSITLLSLAILYDQITKRIPSRLHVDQAPKSDFGLLPATENHTPVRAHGIE
jgi:hypothetical protein